ncbi:MAG: murein biosynthesis integral membrane protein MurJ [Pelagibacteraceae bacterium TMED216]|nr:MAG: murein biosynthesis integral membrane protein MurJ [Pelagibacteraceae bacterium TMED216]|tara:strand:+ start:2496 stop:4025 length:1530 start_codon:yes stop_codon:yes gene_type:complete
MNLLSSTSVFSFFTLISRILGYLRDILIAFFIGTSIYADAFFVAFRLPNTFRRLFAEGTFNAAFIPSYQEEKLKSKGSAKNFADEVLCLIFIFLFFLVLLAEIFMPFLATIIAPGFKNDYDKFNLVVDFARITFPFLLFVTLASFFSGILNSNNKFAAAAGAPIILNLILILVLIISYFTNSDYAMNLSYGVSIAGLLQLIFLFFITVKFYKPSFRFKLKIGLKIKKFFSKLLPSIFSSGVTQINILVGTIIASFQSGAVSYLYYADRVYQINLAIAGIAVSTVSLPALARAVKKKKINLVKKIQNKSLELSLLLSLPAGLGLIIASEEIINALFGYGSFSTQDVLLTSKALVYFGYGVPAFALIKILSNLFFARDNTKIPFYISTAIVLLNVSISIVFFNTVGFLIIPLATSISTWIGVIIFFITITKREWLIFGLNNFKNIFKISLSTVIMSIILVFSLYFFRNFLDYSNSFKFVYLLFIVISSAMIYLILCQIQGLLKIKNFRIIS